MAEYTKASYDKILSLESEMENLRRKLVVAMNEAKESVDKLDNNDMWRGDGYQEYQNKMSRFKADFNAASLELQKLTSNLQTVVANYQEADKQAMQAINNA